MCVFGVVALLLLFILYQSGVNLPAVFIFCLENLLDLAEELSSDDWLNAKTFFIILYYTALSYLVRYIHDPRNKEGEGEEEGGEEKEQEYV